jgi:RNA polymerase primary sigma factor
MHSDSDYRIVALRQLRDQQVRFAPREKKIEQARSYGIVDPRNRSDRDYTYEYHLFSMFPRKPFSRWRQLGFGGPPFSSFDGRKRIGFLRGSVDRFVAGNHDRVKRGERFRQLTDQERDEIAERARRLAAVGGCPHEVARRIAKHMNRSVETIRYTLKQFDEKHPNSSAIFPDHTGPLSPELKNKIYRQYRSGTSVEALAKRFGRTKTSIYRVVNEMRANKILELPLDYMYNEEFDKANVDRRILGPMPLSTEQRRKSRVPSGLPHYLASLYEVPC